MVSTFLRLEPCTYSIEEVSSFKRNKRSEHENCQMQIKMVKIAALLGGEAEEGFSYPLSLCHQAPCGIWFVCSGTS